MKTTAAFAISAYGFVLGSISASAASVSLIEDSAIRLAFDVEWGPLPPLTVSYDRLHDTDSDGHIYVIEDNVKPYAKGTMDVDVVDFGELDVLDVFNINLGPTRVFLGATPDVNCDAVEILPSPSSDYGARFVYGTPFSPLAPSLPDSGLTPAMLLLSLGGMCFLRRAS